MQSNNQEQAADKVAMGISLVIALCAVGIFCALSITVIEHIDGVSLLNKAKYIELPHSKDPAELVI